MPGSHRNLSSHGLGGPKLQTKGFQGCFLWRTSHCTSRFLLVLFTHGLVLFMTFIVSKFPLPIRVPLRIGTTPSEDPPFKSTHSLRYQESGCQWISFWVGGEDHNLSSWVPAHRGRRWELLGGGSPAGHLEVSLQCLRTSSLSCQAALDYRFSLAPFPHSSQECYKRQGDRCRWFVYASGHFSLALFYRGLDEWFSNMII